MALQVVAYTIEKMVRTTQPMRVGIVVVSHLVCDSQEKKLRKDAKEKAEGHNHNPKNNTTTSSNGNNNAAKEGPTAAMPVPPTSARMQNVLQNGMGASFSSSFNSIQSTPTNKVSGVVFRNAHSPLTCFIFFNGVLISMVCFDFNGVCCFNHPFLQWGAFLPFLRCFSSAAFFFNCFFFAAFLRCFSSMGCCSSMGCFSLSTRQEEPRQPKPLPNHPNHPT